MAKQKRKRAWVWNALIAVVLAGVGVCAYQIGKPLLEYKAGADAYVELAAAAASTPAPAAATAEPEAARGVRRINFAWLTSVNSDVIGWLESPGTVINYPIVRGEDNEYYLTHLFTGVRNKLGSLFADYRNAADFSDRNTILYGHHMKSGSMFASLVEYKRQTYYETHPTMTLYTPAGHYTLEVFAGFVTSGQITTEDEGAFQREFADDAEFLAYVERARQQSDFQSSVAVAAEDRLVTLVTCTYEYSDARYVVLCKLSPPAG